MARALSFVDFCDKLLGVTLEPGQLVFCKVAYDHVDPCDLPDDQRAIARRIFGNVDRVPVDAHRVIASVIGGRAGKSYLATLRLLHLCCTVSLDGILAAGQRAHAAIIAPDVDTAMEALVYFVGACNSCPKLAGTVSPKVTKTVIEDGKMVEGFIFRRPLDGRHVEVAVRAVRNGGANVRGRWYVGALMDEACLFYDSSYKLSDDAVYKAIKPRLVEGGQLMLSSTPWLDTGVLYTLWESEFGKPKTALVAHAPTLELRPTHAHTRKIVEAEYATDPDNARREFGAEFGTGSPADWLDKIALRGCVREEPPAPPQAGEDIAAGGDLAFTKNSSALVVVVRNPSTGRVRITRLEERRPQMGAPLKPSVVCREFASILAGDGLDEMVADRVYQETVREHLDEAGLMLGEPPDPDEAWALVKDLVRTGLLDLADATPTAKLLLRQLGAVKCRRVAKGRVVIVLEATRDGRHSDLAAALALAIWAAVHRGKRVTASRPAAGSAEAMAAFEERAEQLREQRVAREQGQAWWESANDNDSDSEAYAA
jgi:hypothetical protein